MKKSKHITRRTIQKENSQTNSSHTTITNRNPDILDHALNKIHPVLGYVGDILQSSGNPFAKIETKQQSLGKTIVQQVKSVNKSVEDIIKQNIKVPKVVEQNLKPMPRPQQPYPAEPIFIPPPPPTGQKNYPNVEPINMYEDAELIAEGQNPYEGLPDQ